MLLLPSTRVFCRCKLLFTFERSNTKWNTIVSTIFVSNSHKTNATVRGKLLQFHLYTEMNVLNFVAYIFIRFSWAHASKRERAGKESVCSFCYTHCNVLHWARVCFCLSKRQISCVVSLEHVKLISIKDQMNLFAQWLPMNMCFNRPMCCYFSLSSYRLLSAAWRAIYSFAFEHDSCCEGAVGRANSV